jgi:hypothetical protein
MDKLKFTSTPPTEEGYYWARYTNPGNPTEHKTPVLVYVCKGPNHDEFLHLHLILDPFPWPVEAHPNVEWAGPVDLYALCGLDSPHLN